MSIGSSGQAESYVPPSLTNYIEIIRIDQLSSPNQLNMVGYDPKYTRLHELMAQFGIFQSTYVLYLDSHIENFVYDYKWTQVSYEDIPVRNTIYYAINIALRAIIPDDKLISRLSNIRLTTSRSQNNTPASFPIQMPSRGIIFRSSI
jgi:hypothetical protein